MISCPNTGRPVATGIEVEPGTFEQLPDVLAHTSCPHCGLDHSWWKREAWLNGHGAAGGSGS
jgi:hypothetical protein